MAGTLAWQLEERKQASRSRFPARTLTVMDAATGEVAASGIAGTSLAVGARAPLFTLPDATGVPVSLSSLLADGPVVLSFSEKLELAFPVLSDVGNTVAGSFGLVFTLPGALREVYAGLGIDLPAANGDETSRLPIPATYVIGAGRAQAPAPGGGPDGRP